MSRSGFNIETIAGACRFLRLFSVRMSINVGPSFGIVIDAGCTPASGGDEAEAIRFTSGMEIVTGFAIIREALFRTE